MNSYDSVHGPDKVHTPPQEGIDLVGAQDDLDLSPQIGQKNVSDGYLSERPKKSTERNFLQKRVLGIALITVGLIVGSIISLSHMNQGAMPDAMQDASQRFEVQAMSLPALSKQLDTTQLQESHNLTVNGLLTVNDSLVIQPLTQPSSAVAGQLYFDQGRNQLAYYNGSQFVYLEGSQVAVTSLGGATGTVTLSTGLSQSNGQLINSGVLSLQGQTGSINLVSGLGIGISGTTISNTGVISIGGQTGTIVIGAGISTSGGVLHNTGALSVLSGGPGITVSNDGSGNYTITSTGGGGGSGTVSSPGGNSGQIPVFTGAQSIADSILSQSGSTITLGGTLNATTLQGNGVGITNVNASNIASGSLSDSRLSTNVALLNANNNFTGTTLTHNGNTVCDTSGNCAGVGGGVTTLGGVANKLAKFTGSQAIGDSIISDNGTGITVTPTADSTAVLGVQNAAGHGIFTVDTTNNHIILGNVTSSAGQGVTGVLVFADGTSDNFDLTLNTATLTANRSIIIPDSSGTVAVSATGPLQLSATGNLTCPNCVTAGGAGGGQASVDSVDSLNGALTLANSSGSGTTITINSASTSQMGIAEFNSTNFTVSGGVVDTIQDIAATSAPSFARLNLTSSQATNPMLIVNNTNVSATGNLLGLQLNGTSEFSVAPNGNVTTNGTVNGQTISSTASFTGSLVVAGTTTLSGGATVSGTLVTSTITPGSALTIGSTSQAFTLQGSSTSTVTASGGGFVTRVGFNGTPTGAVTYNFDRSAAAGTYTICSTVGNCAGSGGGVTTTGGTNGTIPVFTGSQTVANSLISQSGSTVTTNGNLNLTTGNQFQVNGSQISSSNLSDGSSLAKLNAAQTFTGTNNTFKNSTNSTSAFTVQNASGYNFLNIDTTNSKLTLGNITTSAGQGVAGTLVLADGTADGFGLTVASATLTANQTITLPNATGTVCLTSQNCSVAGSGYILDQSATPGTAQSGNFNILGTGIAGVLEVATTGRLDTSAAGTLSIGTTNATTIQVGSASGATAQTINIGNDTNAGTSVTVGSTNGSSGSTIIQGGSGLSAVDIETNGGFLSIGSNGTSQFVDIGTGSSSSDFINIGSSSTAGITLEAATSYINLDNTSPILGTLVQSIGSNSYVAFQVQNKSSLPLLNVNTIASTTTFGNITTSAGQGVAGTLVLADGTADGFGLTVASATLTANQTITLPNATGTVCLQGSTSCSFAPTSGSANYIQNTTTAQAANFALQGASSTAPSGLIEANNGGSGDVLDLQNGTGVNVVTVGNSGAVLMKPSANVSSLVVDQNSNATPTADIFDVNGASAGSFIQVTSTAANAGTVSISSLGAGNAVTIATAASTAASTGSISIQSGNATTGTNLSAGTVSIDTGTETGSGSGTVNIGDANATNINVGSSSANSTSITIGKNGQTSTNFKGTSFTMGADASRSISLNLASSAGNAVTDSIKIGNTSTAGSTTNVTIGPTASTTAAGTEIVQSEGIADTITGSATTPTDIIKTTTNSTGAFQVQNSSSTALLNVDTSGMIVTIAGTTTTFSSLTVTNAHIKSTQTTAPAIGTPSNCGTGPTAAVTAGSTDSAGSFTITGGTGSPTTCDTVITFNKAYGAAPKAIMITPTTAVGTSPQGLVGRVSASSSTTFTVQIAPTSPTASTLNAYYYWIVE